MVSRCIFMYSIQASFHIPINKLNTNRTGFMFKREKFRVAPLSIVSIEIIQSYTLTITHSLWIVKQ